MLQRSFDEVVNKSLNFYGYKIAITLYSQIYSDVKMETKFLYAV